MHHCWATVSFPPPPHPRYIPEAGRMDRQATDCHVFVPVCWANLSRQKSLFKVPYYSSEAGRPIVICDSRLYEVTRLHGLRSESNHHPGDGKSNSANLWHISRNCHFLQSHKRESELLALVSCVVFPCRLLEWNSPDYHWVSKSEWHQFYLTCLKAFAS